MPHLSATSVSPFIKHLAAYTSIAVFLFIGIAFGKPYATHPARTTSDLRAAWVVLPPSDPPAPIPPVMPDTPTPAPVPSRPPAMAPGPSQGPYSGSCDGDWECFRQCTIDHESRFAGVYAAVSGDGVYRGAFQYLASTWKVVAVNAGHAEWADTPVNEVPPEIQDAVAEFHYSVAGNRPWGGRC